uniref:site-specific DNA-methyltransferase (adenine-specific) n=1 Tax=Xanthomonas campestris TaxID=339 RepID=G3JXC5_XANCA|nr:M.XcmI [Xanthomonas campestris]
MDRLGVRRLVRRMQDVLRTDAGVDGDAQRLAQIAWLLYFKAAANDPGAEFTWGAYRDRFALRRQGVVDFTNRELLPHLKALAGTSADRGGVSDDFRNYVTSDEVLGELIDLIDRLPTQLATDRHIVSDVYETLLGSLRNAKNSGEFYTPRALTRFMVEVLSPTGGSSILDPASGTGGFLVSALEYVREREGQKSAESLKLHAREKKSLPHLLCATNLLLHDYTDASNIRRTNPLSQFGTSAGDNACFDFVLANPPFGGEEEPGVEANFPLEYKSRDTSLLFVLYIIAALKHGGQGAIILPDGFMFQTGVCARVREHLLRTCDVRAVVRLPKGAFAPYTGIETNLLFFTKGTPTESVLFYEHRYPEGVKNYSKTKPLQFQELQPMIACLKGGMDVAEGRTTSVPIAEIEKDGWSLNFRKQAKAVAPSLKMAAAQYENSAASRAVEVGKLQAILEELVGVGGLERFKEILPVLASTPRGLQAIERATLSLAFARTLTSAEPEGAVLALDGWQFHRLEDLGRIVGGATPPSDDPGNFEEGGIPWLTPADLRGMSGKYIGTGRRSLSRAGYHACSVELLPKGSVLFSSRAPIGYVAIADNELCTNQGFKSCIPFDESLSDYLFYYLKFLAPEIDRKAPGTTFKEVSGRIMKKIEIHLPSSLDERNSLVRWLDNAFAQLHCLRVAASEEMKWREALYESLGA